MSNTSNAAQHGPAPFKFGKTSPEQRMILDAKGKYVCNVQIYQTPRSFGLFDEPQREANAAFIVRAVNAHGQLMAALKIADQFCGSLTSDVCPDAVHIPIRAALSAAEA